MRTSRISRDTSKILNVLSPRKQPLRDAKPSSLNSNASSMEADVTEHRKQEQGNESDSSELSSVPSDFDDTDCQHVTEVSTSSRKRKRAAETPPTNTQKRSEETIVTKIEPQDPAASPEIAKPTSKATKARRQPAKVVYANGRFKTEPPPHWEEVYNLTKEMRSKVLAPVDTMGCASLAEKTQPPNVQRFQTLVSLMLSAQTKDTVTAATMWNLQEKLPGGLTIESILAVSVSDLDNLIRKVGFHANKAKYIKATAEILHTRFKDDIPSTIPGLISLPGVGPKMAHLTMSAAWGRTEGIGVDVHVHRITNLWGWHKTKNPEETRAALESWLPREKWYEINHLLVGFGQTICLPVGRKCGQCVLADRGLCPSAIVAKEVKKSVKREEVVVKKDGEEEEVVEKELADVEVKDIKAEEVDGDGRARDGSGHKVPDIEDIGGTSTEL